MSLIAAFLWNKSPRCSISTMILNDKNMQFLSRPKISYLPKGFFRFRKATKEIIKEFFTQIEQLHKAEKKSPVIVEFKIVFQVHAIPYLFPAKESAFVYRAFKKTFKKTKKNIKSIRLKPQLRKRLSGRALKQFKKELRSLYVVSRKRDTNFEYHLWTVALHATPATYAGKLQQVRKKLLAEMWKSL